MSDNMTRLGRNTPLRDYLDHAASAGQVPPARELDVLPSAEPDATAWRRSVEQHAETIARARRAGNNAYARRLARDVPAELAAGALTPEPDPPAEPDPDEIAAQVWRP